MRSPLSMYQTVSARTRCGLSETAGTWWGCCQALETDTICVRQNHAGTTCSILETEIEHLKRRWSRTWVSSGDTEKTWDILRIIFLARYKCCYTSLNFPYFKVCNKSVVKQLLFFRFGAFWVTVNTRKQIAFLTLIISCYGKKSLLLLLKLQDRELNKHILNFSWLWLSVIWTYTKKWHVGRLCTDGLVGSVPKYSATVLWPSSPS